MKDELIDVVIDYPAIWDKNHKQHHNRHVLALMWTKIAAKMGATEREVRSCWKNLRQEFGKQFRKLANRTTDDLSDISACQWPYFTKLMFLRDQFDSLETSSNLIETREDLSALSAANNADSDSDFYFNIDEDNCMSLTHHSTQSVPSPASDQEPVSAMVPVQTSVPSSRVVDVVAKTGYKRRLVSQDDSGKQRFHHHHLHEVDHVETERAAPGMRMRFSYDHDDEDIGFFTSILPHVRKLTPRNKLVFRMRVQQTLFDIAFPEEKPSQSETR